MAKKNDWMKRGLLGSTTLPLGTGGTPFTVPHVHTADGNCCGHDHGHRHHHDENCDHSHDHDEDCTSPKGSC